MDRRLATVRYLHGQPDALVVATEVAARGLDFPNLGCVINYDFPQDIIRYVHRIGRTGRVGNPGLAVSFFTSPDDNPVAAPLLRCITDVGQTPPEWLIKLVFTPVVNNSAAKLRRQRQAA
eukprot:RCo054045